MASSKKILITGGSGMIGTRLTELLTGRGYEVAHLSRSKRNPDIKTFLWSPPANEIETGALTDIDAIIHLAGAGIADKRWNADVREEILLSRIQSAGLLAKTLRKEPHRVQALISASGISYYGLVDPGRPFVESDPPAGDFLAQVTIAWEKDVVELKDVLRTVSIRCGAVLSTEGGALVKLAQPVKFFVGAPLGSGKQYVNWVHVDDVCGIYIKAIEDTSMRGAYNAVAPHPVTNKELTQEIARVLKRPLWLPPVPGVVVKLIAGDVAEFVLEGVKVSSEKIEKAGYHFRYNTIRSALEDLLAK
jgi:uncharacterized protein